ncbi:MAG: BatA domain-containing protein [Myxococcota bacterium]
MSFLQPWMLGGLLAAFLPIVIHLIFRRRPRRHPFPAIELLLNSAQRVENRWRLRRILLLASRVAILAFFAFAAARPFLPTPDAPQLSSRGPVRRALVIDASLSMTADYDGRTAFRRARELAIDRVRSAGPEEQTIVIRAGARAEVVTGPSAVQSDLVRTIQDLECDFRSGDLGAAVTLAARTLAEGAPEEARFEIVVFSDFAQGSIRSAADLSGGTDSRPELALVDVVGQRDRSNVALTSFRAEPVPSAAPRTLEFEGRIRSFRGSGVDTSIIRLRQDAEQLTEQSISIDAGTISDQRLRHTFEDSGTRFLTLELSRDRLAADNVQYGVARLRRQVRALVVNGDPSGIPKEDETFYLDAALRAGASDHPPPVVVSADDLPTTRLDVDVVFLAGVASLSMGEGERLRQFIRRGGGLFVAVAEGLDPEAYNSALGPVLPRRIRGMKRLGEGVVGSSGALGITLVRPNHPVLEVFRGDGTLGLTSARTRGILLLEPSSQGSLDVLLAYDDGQPALLAHRVDAGRVLLLTTSIDRGLSDLAIRPGFVPLIRQALLWLGRGLVPSQDQRTLVGESRRLVLPDGVDRVQIVGPVGPEQETFTVLKHQDEAVFRRTDRPGHYRVMVASQPDNRELDFAVNLDPSDSDLRRMRPSDVEALLSGQREGRIMVTADASDVFNPRSIATLLLLLMAGAFVLEGILSSRQLGR